MLPTPDQLIAFTFAAVLLIVTPGLDTALILRTTASDGPRRALMAGIGIALGCLGWGLMVAVGLGAVLNASQLAYDILRWVGAAYLVYLGLKMLRSPRHGYTDAISDRQTTSAGKWLVRGFLTNILNPKMGVFYVSFLPQFLPSTTDVLAGTVLLATIHAVLGITWFAVLIVATRPISRALRDGRIVTWLDRITGGVFVVFGVRLAFEGGR
jgi:RhtB (resistance to homoserine/threonine) family protein